MRLFSASWCTNCTPIKDYINSNNINCEVLDLDSSFEEAQKLGVRGIPALVTNEDSVIVGQANVLNFLRGINA